MKSKIKNYDVLVIGGGAAGIAAAIAAAKNNARTLLVESRGAIGGDTISGLPILGCCNSLGEWIVGGVLRELLDACKRMSGYIGCICDWRTLWGVCVNPDIFRLVIAETLEKYRVDVLLHTIVDNIAIDNGRIQECFVVDRSGKRRCIRAKVIIEATGDGNIAAMANAKSEAGSDTKNFQPISLIFRMSNINFKPLLEFVRDNPEEILLAENPVFKKTPAECAQKVYESGYPYLALSARGTLLGDAIRRGLMYPCSAIFMSPTSMGKKEIVLNTTRVSGIDARNIETLSNSLFTLSRQISTAIEFLKIHIPGFRNSELSGIAHSISIRETRRIIGEYVLKTEDVISGKKVKNGIAKGAHHVDIHGSGTDQTRIPVKNGHSYDIPYNCLIPKNIANMFVAGRCLSSTREANGSVRVMGTCMATGEAAGTAAALYSFQNHTNVRELSVEALRKKLTSQGAILKGTH
ncbi:FAD-dependent oxidoreductase [bacterium]|nr:FAD-dependent oxidoreductase [bacterium]